MKISEKSFRKIGTRLLLLVVLFLICTMLVNSFFIIPLSGLTDDQNNSLTKNSESVRVLFDEAHYPMYGVVYSPNVQIYGGQLSKLTSLLESNNFAIDTLDFGETINESNLAECDIFVICVSLNSYLPEEIEKLYSWVIAGGSLLLISDYGPRHSTVTSIIAERFGYELGECEIWDWYDYNTNFFYLNHIGANIKSHEITTGISRIETYRADGIIGSPKDSRAIITTDDDGTAYWNVQPNYPANNVPILSVNEKWNYTYGKIAVLTDCSLLNGISDTDMDGDQNILDSDNEVLALNLFNWLGSESTLESSTQSIYFSFIAILGVFVYLTKYRRKYRK